MHHPIEDNRCNLIFLHEERILGYVLSWGAHASLVKYSVGGIEYQVWMENNEFVHLGKIYEEV